LPAALLPFYHLARGDKFEGFGDALIWTLHSHSITTSPMHLER
jgi:hypothetical protein